MEIIPILSFFKEGNPNLTCIFVDNANYMQTTWGNNIDPASTFVETQTQCDALGLTNTLIKDIAIYPNPTNGKLFIEFPKNDFKSLQVEIMDLSGRFIMEAEIKRNQAQLNISILEKGIYFLKINGEESQALIRKIIKL